MSVKVSVVVPVYNGEAFLRECLDSIAVQTLHDIEILCVDDGSSDGSAALLKEYAEKDARFRFLPQENRGVSAARNRAMAQAQGDFLAFMDCDDRYPDAAALEKLHSAAVRNHADICGGSLCEIHPDGHVVSEFSGRRAPLRFREAGWIGFEDLPFEYAFQRFLFRRPFLLENKLEYPPYRTYEDPVFLVRAMIAAKRFYAIPDPVYLYRQRGTARVYGPDAVRDLVSGGLDILRAANDAGLAELRRKYAEDFFGDFSEGDESAAGNLCVRRMLDGDIPLAKQLLSASDVLGGKLIAPLARILGTADARITPDFFDSPSWSGACARFRRMRKIRGFFRCLRENGLLYTVRRALKRR